MNTTQSWFPVPVVLIMGGKVMYAKKKKSQLEKFSYAQGGTRVLLKEH